MLHYHHGDAHRVDLSEKLDRFLQFCGSETGQRLVEQHEPWAGRKHTRNLKALAPRGPKRAGPAIGLPLQAGKRQNFERMRASIVRIWVAKERADHDVIENSHLLERRRHLKSAADACDCMSFR